MKMLFVGVVLGVVLSLGMQAVAIGEPIPNAGAERLWMPGGVNNNLAHAIVVDKDGYVICSTEKPKP